MEKEQPPSGNIVHIQRYSLHDGPGIRTLIFLKGCPLTCPWCSNPEAIHPFPELIHYRDRCIRCEACVQACPTDSLEFVGDDLRICNDRSCRSKRCVEVCPTGALEILGQTMTVDDVLRKVMQDFAFYKRSGGGVTFSGGEPLSQDRFLLTLLGALKAESIHTAIETTGYQRWERFARILEKVDLVYYDLKIIDPREHKRLLGVSNGLILENAKRMMERQPGKVVFRMPAIPGYTDSEINLKGIVGFLKAVGYSPGALEIIPYHRFGESKYDLLHREYKLKGTRPPTPEELRRCGAVIRGEG